MTLNFLDKTKTFSILFLLFFTINSHSQFTAVTDTDTDPKAEKKTVELKSDKTAPTAIPIVNIIEAIEIAREKIKDIKKKVQSKSFILNIDSIYPAYKVFIANNRIQAENYISSSPNKQKANKLLNEWKRYHDYLKSWEASINKELKKNSIILEEVKFAKKTWKLTLELAQNKNLPTEIIKNITVIRDEFKNVKESIVNQNNKDLGLESKINYLTSVTIDVIEDIENLKTTEVYNIFHKRHNTLWNTPFKSADNSGLPKEKKAYFGNISLEFLKTFKTMFYLFIFLVVGLIYFIKYLKIGFDKYKLEDSNPDTDNQSILLKQSKLIIVFISLIWAKLLFPTLPDLINDLITLLLLLSTIPIVNPTISKKFKNIVYLVILFFALDSAKTYVWFESYQYRLYLLFEAFLVLISLYYFTHPYKEIKEIAKTKLSQFLIKLTPIFYLLIIISIASNIVGYTNLTDISLKICTQGIVLSVIFFAILRVVESLSNAVLHRHYGADKFSDHLKMVEVKAKITKYIRLTMFVVWLIQFLKILDLLKPILNFFDDILSEPYSVGAVTFKLSAILIFLIILVSSYFITKLIAFILDEGENTLKFLHLPKGIPRAISVISRYIILALGFIFAISSLGIDLSEFNLMAGALGLGIGFGLQNVISNFVSGLILIFERPILTGDTVEVNNLMGTVNKIGIRSSTVSTFDGADVIVPNNNLVSNDLINWTSSSSLKRVEILIGTTYGSDPNLVLKILLECANNYPELVKNPAPNALFSDFGDNSLNFRIRFWTHFSLGLQAKSDVSIAIYNKFKEHNIEIPFPQQDVYIKDFPKYKTDKDD